MQKMFSPWDQRPVWLPWSGIASRVPRFARYRAIQGCLLTF